MLALGYLSLGVVSLGVSSLDVSSLNVEQRNFLSLFPYTRNIQCKLSSKHLYWGMASTRISQASVITKRREILTLYQ